MTRNCVTKYLHSNSFLHLGNSALVLHIMIDVDDEVLTETGHSLIVTLHVLIDETFITLRQFIGCNVPLHQQQNIICVLSWHASH